MIPLRQARKHVHHVVPGVDFQSPAGFYDREDSRDFWPRFFPADMEPVFPPHGQWPDAVFAQVVVYLDLSVFQIPGYPLLLIERITAGFAQRAGRQNGLTQFQDLSLERFH